MVGIQEVNKWSSGRFTGTKKIANKKRSKFLLNRCPPCMTYIKGLFKMLFKNVISNFHWGTKVRLGKMAAMQYPRMECYVKVMSCLSSMHIGPLTALAGKQHLGEMKQLLSSQGRSQRFLFFTVQMGKCICAKPQHPLCGTIFEAHTFACSRIWKLSFSSLVFVRLV